jgi:methyltransferase (TIGR00027 family)
MEDQQPSRTAQGAALHRAAHQLWDHPPVFADPLAIIIIGPEAATELRAGRDQHAMTESAGLRAFLAVRSRFTEDRLADAQARGVRQYVLLGAGLDTFAYRTQQSKLRVFEVDHPATQGWKRARLAAVGIAIPETVRYAAVDFETGTLEEGLYRAGFDFDVPAMFAWLGVTPYLTADAVLGTLAWVASLPAGSEIVFDYAGPGGHDDGRARVHFEALSARVAAAGEPFRSFFEPASLVEVLRKMGYSEARDYDATALNALYFHNRSDGLLLRGRGHLMRATV